MRTKFVLCMFMLLTAIIYLTSAPAQGELPENTGTPKIGLIVADPAHDDLKKSRIDKVDPAEVEEAEMPVQDSASDHFNRGVAHDSSGMYREAIDSYKKAIMIKPDYTEAYYNLAFSYLMSNDVKSAHEEYLLLKEINPQKADEFYNKALLMVRSNPDNKYVIQVGAFRNIQNADHMLEKLKAHYLHAQIEALDGFSKVRVFGMKNKEEAEVMMKDIRDKFKIDPFLVPAR